MAIKRITGGNFIKNTLGIKEPVVSEFLMDGDSTKEDLPKDSSVAVGSQALKLVEDPSGTAVTEVYIYGPSLKWYRYSGVSFLN